MFEATENNGYPKHSNHKVFLCTSEDDVSKLPKWGIKGTQTNLRNPDDNEPCAIGSQAIIKNGSVYMLFPDNEWAKM